MARSIKIALPAGRQKTLNMFADQEVVQKAGGRHLGRKIPRHDQRHQQCHAAHPWQAAEHAPVPGRHQPKGDGDGAKDHGRRTLGQHADRQSQKHGIAPVAVRIRDRPPEPDHDQRRAQGHRHIGHHKGRSTKEHGHRRQNNRRDQCRIGPDGIAHPGPDQNQDRQRRQKNRQARRRLGHAKGLHSGG